MSQHVPLKNGHTRATQRASRFVKSLLLAFPCVGMSVTTTAAPAPPSSEARAIEVTIMRDGYGMPHIYAKTVYSLFYGYGYAVAQDRLFQMEMARRSTQGTVAEVLGEKYVAFDKSVRANYWPASIERQLSALPARDRDILEGYAAGMNAWIAKVRAQPGSLMPKQFNDFSFAPSNWSAYDVAMVFVGTMANRYSDATSELDNLALVNSLKDKYGAEQGMSLFNQLKWLVNPDAPTTVSRDEGKYTVRVGPQPNAQAQALPRYDGPSPTLARLAQGSDGRLLDLPPRDNAATMLAQIAQYGQAGQAGFPTTSNIWIVGRKKAKGASAIMLNGPQMGWFVPAYTYGVGLHGAGFDIVGNTPFAYPCILFGHNGRISWGATAGVGDDVDIFAEQVAPDNANRYFHDGRWLNMEKRVDVIKVKDAAPVVFEVERTMHGIVIQRDDKQHIAYAKARAWDGLELQSLLAWTHQGEAHDWRSWTAEAARQALTINWYYADRAGNIGYVYTGKFPDRRPGHDPRLPVPGSGEWDWRGLLPFATNPKVYNPKQGWIANWNNAPEQGYPASDLLTFVWGGADRVAEIDRQIESRGRLGLDDMWQILEATSAIDVNRSHFLPFIKEATASLPATDPRRIVAQQLIDWDGYNRDPHHTGGYENAGPAIMDAWLSAMLQRTLGRVVPPPYDKWFVATGYAAPQDGPTGSANISNGSKVLYEALRGAHAGMRQDFDIFQGRPRDAVILDALDDTVHALQARLGDDLAHWRAPAVPLTFRANNFFGVPQANSAEAITLPDYMNRGTENDLVVFGAPGAHGGTLAWDVVAPGESGFIAPDGNPSRHYTDQVDLYRSFGKKPLMIDKADVARHTESVEQLRLRRVN